MTFAQFRNALLREIGRKLNLPMGRAAPESSGRSYVEARRFLDAT